MRLRLLVLAFLTTGLAASPLAAQRLVNADLDDLEQRALADSNDAVAHYELGLGYWNEGRFDEAVRSFETALEIDGRFAEVYLALAALPFAQRAELWTEIAAGRVPAGLASELEESNELYRRAFRINPLVDLKILGAVTPTDSASWSAVSEQRVYYQTLSQGFADMLKGNYNGAYKRYRDYARDIGWRDEPQLAPESLLWYRALAAAHAGKWREAGADMTIVLDRALTGQRPDSLIAIPLNTNELRYVLASLFHEAGWFAEAEHFYAETLENDPGFYTAHLGIARIHEARGEWLSAAERCRRALDANPNDTSILHDLGVTLGRGGFFGESEQVLLRAQDTNPRDARIPYILGLVQLSWGKFDEAQESFTHFLSIAPSRMELEIEDARRRLASLSAR
jgi:Tfp pilus assembly protein PilF